MVGNLKERRPCGSCRCEMKYNRNMMNGCTQREYDVILISVFRLIDHTNNMAFYFNFDPIYFVFGRIICIFDLISSISQLKLLLVLINMHLNRGWVSCRQGMLKTFPDPLAALLMT